MEDEQNGLVGDVEAAPQPINIISQQPQTSSLTISGDVNQFTATPVQNTPQGSYKFVMGPNGQMIAIEKPPFVWKQFLIGGGIPFAIFFIPMVIMMIASGLGYDDNDATKEVSLYKDENTTIYRGEFTLDEDNYLSWCSATYNESSEYIDIYCDRYEDYRADIYRPAQAGDFSDSSQSSTLVGNWDNENGSIYFNDGEDYGDQIQIKIGYYVEEGGYEFFMIVSDLAGVTCCFGLVLSIIFLIVGFSQGKPGMGWGGVASLVLFPVMAVATVIVMW